MDNFMISPTGLSPAAVTLSSVFGYHSAARRRRSYNPDIARDNDGLGSCAFARHYLRNRSYFLFLRVLRCFSSPRSPHINSGVIPRDDGFPHSDIGGS